MMRFEVKNPWGGDDDGEVFRFEVEGDGIYEGFSSGCCGTGPCAGTLPPGASEEDVISILAHWYPRATSIESKFTETKKTAQWAAELFTRESSAAHYAQWAAELFTREGSEIPIQWREDAVRLSRDELDYLIEAADKCPECRYGCTIDADDKDYWGMVKRLVERLSKLKGRNYE